MATLAPPFSQCFFAASAIAFAASTYIFAPWNDVPWALPVPGDGSLVRTPFFLSTPGNFSLSVTVPTPSKSVDSSMPTGYSLPCIKLAIDSEADTEIADFEPSGLFVYGKLAYLDSARKFHLGYGDHTAALRTCTPVTRSESFIEFHRSGEPKSMFIGPSLVRGAGWLLLALGAIAELSKAFSSRLHKGIA